MKFVRIVNLAFLLKNDFRPADSFKKKIFFVRIGSWPFVKFLTKSVRILPRAPTITRYRTSPFALINNPLGTISRHHTVHFLFRKSDVHQELNPRRPESRYHYPKSTMGLFFQLMAPTIYKAWNFLLLRVQYKSVFFRPFGPSPKFRNWSLICQNKLHYFKIVTRVKKARKSLAVR